MNAFFEYGDWRFECALNAVVGASGGHGFKAGDSGEICIIYRRLFVFWLGEVELACKIVPFFSQLNNDFSVYAGLSNFISYHFSLIISY